MPYYRVRNIYVQLRFCGFLQEPRRDPADWSGQGKAPTTGAEGNFSQLLTVAAPFRAARVSKQLTNFRDTALEVGAVV
jgi:hypothetical protein